MHGNTYAVDAALVGRQVEVVFDPFDLATLEVRYQGRSMGIAVPHRIGRHVHPQARPDLPPPAASTGIDYLALVAAQHRAEVAAQINYTDLPSSRTADAGAAARTDAAPGPELEAELASFTLLRKEFAGGELPGQLDLTDLTDPTDLTDDSSEGQR